MKDQATVPEPQPITVMTSVELPTRGFCDLNIPLSCDDGRGEGHLRARIERAFKLGYDTVAVNVDIHQDDMTTSAQEKKAKKAKVETKSKDFPEPPTIAVADFHDVAELQTASRRLRIFKRLTVTFNDNSILTFFNKSTTVSKYDLIAICPTSSNALKNILQSGFRADIIAFDPENARDVRWNRKLYMSCVEKHLYFELCYSPMIRDSTKRRHIITRSHDYHSTGKSKNIIISSGAQSVMEIRGPYDVANLGFLLGLNEHQGKLAVGKMALEAVRSGVGRQVGPYRAVVQSVKELRKSGQGWKVPGNNIDDDEEEENGAKSDELSESEDDVEMRNVSDENKILL